MNTKALNQRIAEILNLPVSEIILERPSDLSRGDYAIPYALSASKKFNMAPIAIAEEVAGKLREAQIEGVEKIDVANPGFVNIFLKPEVFCNEVLDILEKKDKYGEGEAFRGKRVMVEYTDPNPFKEFHIGHLMTNAIGESLARVYEKSGAEVRRACYQGDVGLHVAKAIWGLLANGGEFTSAHDLGIAYAKGANAYVNDENAKTEIDKLNETIYKKEDEQVNEIYEKGRAMSLEHFEELYKLLGTKFDFYFFESLTSTIGLEIVRLGLQNNIFEESQGAVIFPGEKHGLHNRVFINSRGLATYEAKELGLAKEKDEKWNHDLSIIVTASEVSDYTRVMKMALLETLPDEAEKTFYVLHGLMRFASGKMSSRTGDVITGESLIEDARAKVLEVMKDREIKNKREAIDIVAVGAIKYQILKQATGKDIIFNAEKAFSLEGDSGPYLQYAAVRAKSLSKKAHEAGVEAGENTHTDGYELTKIERLLPRFGEVVERALQDRSLHHITTYALDVASAFNSFYANNQIIGTPEASYRLAIAEASARVLTNCLDTLGIRVPDEM